MPSLIAVQAMPEMLERSPDVGDLSLEPGQGGELIVGDYDLSGCERPRFDSWFLHGIVASHRCSDDAVGVDHDFRRHPNHRNRRSRVVVDLGPAVTHRI